ncbi:uncharacterized protein [Panulirus ornatus]|uniref:uncharacterized protein n=1 Tax=Panulirus ornatus TaxID=150431 RepID=UPI003A8BFF00
MVILPMVIVVTIIIVVIVTLLVRRNMASKSRSCDAAGHQDDAIYGSLGPEDVQVRQGARYERQNSLYATWTSGGENTPDIVSVQIGSLPGSCDVAGHQDDAIYENFGPEEVQERQGARYERQNSLYGSFTSGAGGENTPGSCDVAGHQDDAIYENLGPEEVQVRQGARYERQNSLYATWTSGGENTPDVVSVHTGSHLGREW